MSSISGQQSLPAPRTSRIGRREVDVVDVYPLAPMQEAMLLHGRGARGAGLYVQQFMCTLHEPLGVPAFREAWQRLADRHAVLRTSFHLDASPEPLQRVHARVEVPWTEHDWRHLPAETQEERMTAFLREDRLAPFDPACAPLMRLTLFRTGDEAYRLVWTSHHALLDGHARRILVREVFEEYEARLAGRDFAPPAPRAYREYVEWLRQAEPPASRAFWQETLRGFEQPNDLSLEPGDEGGEGREQHRFRLSEELTTELQRLAQREEVTLNAVLQGAWALLLARYTGDRDVVFGATRACRHGALADTGRIVGLLSNTVPVRVRISGEQSVTGYLDGVRSLWLAMRPHERTHMARIQEWSEVPGGTPLCETLFGFEKESAQEMLHRLGGAWERRTFRLLQWISYPLSVIAHGGAAITFQVVYDPARFGAGAVARMGEHLARLLGAFAADPGQRLDDVEILGPAERSHLLESLNPSAQPYPGGSSVHALFQAQAARTPGAVAVVFQGEALPYAELERRSNQLAHALRKRGVGPEVRVGVCMERSPELVIALFAILKAGGAYVPLDPDYPQDRLAYVLADSGVPLVLCQPHVAGRLPEGGPARMTAEPLWAQAAGESTGPVELRVEPESLAYVIYTSGSTGRPKGAMNAHRGVVNRLLWMQEEYGLDGSDAVLQKTPYSFDVSVWEFFWPLMTGARLVVARPGGHRDPAYLREVIEAERITTLHFVPSMLGAFLEAGGSDAAALRRVVCSGEALPHEMQERFFARFPGVELHNLYGPTEAAVDVTFWACRRGDPRRTVPIGRPVANTRTYVLNARLELVPFGATGELYLGGVQVGRGYLGRPDLTAERFLPDPFAAPGARMYRTGDRARWLADGALEYLGRTDQQVKIRGFRIEPGEIETALREHPRVGDAAVVAREVAPGSTRLVAYVVPAGGAPSPAELRGHLAGRLPGHMVPSAFVALDAFPLTPSGKLDRRSLPEPQPEPEDGYAAPRTPAEEVVAGLFATVLGVERVGARDDFFALGGHSLLAVRLALRLREAVGVELPLHALLDAPTVAELARVVEASRRSGEAVPEAPPIRRAPRDAALPASFAQERLWFIDRLHPGSAAYNVPALFRLEGPLDGAALRRGLETIVARHEALRTTFRLERGEVRQCIRAPEPFPLPLVECGALPGALRLAENEARRPFDLERGPLVRALLLRVDPECHLLLVSLHHIVADGESVGVLLGELRACYEAYSAGGEPALPGLPVQYADYALWQRESLTDERLAPALAYWRGQLSGAEPPALPADRARPAAPRFPGARRRVSFPAALAARAREFGREAHATTFMVLLAGFKALLARYSGQEEVVVVSPVAGREPAEVERLIGFFVNTLALRTPAAPEQGFRAMLERVRETTLRAYEHRHAPFERAVAELQSGGEAGVRLARVMFAFRNAAGETLSLPGLGVHRVPVERGAAKFDLMLSLQETSAGLEGAWEYDAELFDAPTVERMDGHFRRLLESALAAPDAPLAELPLLAGAERREVLDGSAGPVLPAPGPLPVHQLFAAQALRTPAASAAVFRERSLTYAELDRRSSQLAHALRERGVGPEVRVALCFERGLEAIVAVLGVLKAGGAYVPLDPGSPAGRLSAALEECGAPVVLTESRVADRLPAGPAVVLRLDADWPRIARQSGAPPPCGVRPENAAYVIYTSGSTGTPKGVVVQHGSLLNLAEALRLAVYGRRAPDGPARVTVNGPLTFDTSVKQLVQLLRGSTLYVVPEEVRYDGRALAGFLRDNRVEVLDCTPAQLRLLLADGLVEEAGPSLTDVLVAGEAVDEPTWRRLAAGRVAFHNLYGPTECTVDATACAVRDFPDAPVIGRPLANVRTYVLDDRFDPAPYGVPGELYVAGAGVARGYLDRPGLTAERFLPDPFAPGGGERMYRTGDRVRRRADGALEFLGRVDAQVKIRGFRIEPGEIEAVLAQHPAVSAVAVTAREDVAGDRRLVAYVVGRGGTTPAASGLREHLAARLPAYMVPSAFVALDALPVTRHGKVDRRALPAPDPSPSTERYVAPRTAAEEILAGIWAEVLGTERVGAEDDFFHLGGHSLRVARVASRVREALGVELPLAVVFDTPTVEGVARWVEGARRAGGGTRTPPLRRAPRGGALPLSFAQRRLWLLDQLDPGSSAYNVPLVLRLRGELDARALRRALGEVVRRHEVLRTRLVGSGAEAEQRVDAPAPVPLPVVDLHALPEDAREGAGRRLLEEEAARPFDLAAGPVLRARLLRLAAAEHLLSLTLHHAAGDGWSTGILFRELGALYGAFSRGGASPLPELPVQYADYAVWQRERLDGPALEPLLAYWRGKLAGAPPLLEVPTDRPRPAVPGARAATRSVEFPPELVRALRALSRREGGTLFMTLLAGFQALLGRYAGQEDVVVGIPVANRSPVELEPLVGFFVDTLPLRTDLSGDPTVRELLGRVRRSTLEAQAHAELPFERLVEELHPAGSARHSPLFQVLFAVQGEEEAPRIPGLDAERVKLSTGAAKYDLTLVVEERGDEASATLTWRAELYDGDTMERMLAHLARLLGRMAAEPEGRVWQLGLVDEEESLLPGDGGAGVPEAAAGAAVHELFALRAAEAPDRTAVVCGGRTLTYGELDRRANQLARHLRGRGVGADTLVALYLERSPELIVGMLGALKAGAAYLPIDPSTPRERIALVLADAAVPLVLTQDGLRDRLPARAGGVLSLDGGWPEVAREPGEAPRVAAAPESLAYAIFTSGSTGRPKGVMVPHRGLAGLVRWHRRAFGVTADDRATQLAGLGFDASVWEVWPYLACGAALQLVPDEEVRSSPAALQAFLLEQGTTVAFVPTPLAEGMLALEWPARAPLRVLLTGGDRLHARPSPGLPFTLVNNYGPTECSVVATSGPVAAGERGGRAPDIGRAVDGARAYVLDGRMQPVPVGVPGELCIGGAGVARGYLGRPELTSERFAPDPFAGEPGARLFRTGDRVRRLPGGELEFMGRIDRQVKIRGFRIEPGEVEVLLRAHPRVSDAVVVAWEGVPGDPRLVAYVVPAAGPHPSAAELRAALAEHLPEYMLPAAFVPLGVLPLTPNGKVDRRALPAPELEAGTGREHVAPRTPTEALLAGIWAEALGLARVGVRDDFFELGGHSLLAVRVVSRIQRETGMRVPLHAFVAGATVEALAEVVLDRTRHPALSPLVPLGPGGARRPFFCVHAVDGHVLSYTTLAGRLGGERQFYGVQAAGVEGGDPLDRVEAMAAGYLEAIRTAQPAGPYALGGWSMGGVVAFEMARRLHAAGEEVSGLVLIDPPSSIRGDTGADEAEFLMAALRHMLEGKLSASFPGEEFRRLSAAEQMELLRAEAVRAGVLAEGAEAGRLEEILRVRRAHLRALREYRPEAFPGRALLIEAAERASSSAPAERRFEWESLCARGIERVRLPGSHFTLLQEPAVRRLAEEVSAYLDRAEAPRSSCSPGEGRAGESA